MFEAATELPAFLGCPALGPKPLPGGFDGTEPGNDVHGLHGLNPDQNQCKSVKSVDENNKRKHSMDFGRFHVTRAAIPGRTVLTFRRKQDVEEKHGSLVPGRIIIAEIFKQDVGGNNVANYFVLKSYMPGESPRVLFSGQTWVSMSKTEKMVYKMVKCDIKETQRRHISRKRKRDAAKAARAKAAKEVK